MDSRFCSRVCPGLVINIQRSNGEGWAGRCVVCAGVPAGPGGWAGTHCPLLPGQIHEAKVKAVRVDGTFVSVEWTEGDTVKGKEVSAALPRVVPMH